MKKLSTLIGFMLITSITFSQNDAIEEFQNFVDSCGMQFEMPEGYSVIDVKENRDLWYSFAIINADSTMEVRYTIWSLASAKLNYEASLKDSNTLMIPHNNIYKGRNQSNVLNMTGGEWYDIGAFPPQAVMKEFNADAGGSCFFRFNCQFGEGYEFGQFVYLHKDDIADVIITYMSNNQETHSDLMNIAFHSLIFKK